MTRCRVDGCPNDGDQVFGLALMPDNSVDGPASAEGKICLGHANELWKLLGPPPLRATQVMAEELSKVMEDPNTDAVVIHMDKRMTGL